MRIKRAKKLRITPKEQALAEAYVRGDKTTRGNGTQSAIKAYNIGSKGGSKTIKQIRSTASVIAHEVLEKPNVRAYLEGIAMEMAGIIHNIARNGETDTNRLNAAKDVLDRAGYKPVDAIDVTSGGEVIKSIEYIVPEDGSTKP